MIQNMKTRQFLHSFSTLGLRDYANFLAIFSIFYLEVKRISPQQSYRLFFNKIADDDDVKLKAGKFEPQDRLKPLWAGTIFP
jgi:hypothetical protein